MTQNVFRQPVTLLIVAVALSCGFTCFSGCPDFSHLRDEPDYKNMTDSGEEAPEEDSEENK